MKAAGQGQQHGREGGKAEETAIDEQDAHVFGRNDFIDSDGRREQEFKRSQLSFFREQPHRQNREKKHQDKIQTVEQGPEHQFIEVQSGVAILNLQQPNGLVASVDDHEVGDKAGDKKKHRSDDVQDRRHEQTP